MRETTTLTFHSTAHNADPISCALGYINPDDTKNILAIFAKLDTNQNGCISNADAAGMPPASNGVRKKKPKSAQRERRRERDIFESSEDTTSTSNPVAASRPTKKAGMSLGDEDGAARVRGPDGKTRKKVKKKKPRADDEV